MPRIDINFHHVRAHRGSRDHGFEELCAQLAYLEDRPADSTYFRKGIGADGGVECVVGYADGRETGWQAKYFFSFGAAQQKQLDESISQALNKHPHLTRFVVCLPFNLRDARRGKAKSERQRWEEWVKKWNAVAKKSRRKLKIELWDASAITERLSRKDPRYEGRTAFWFDQTILTPDWFKDRFEQLAPVWESATRPKPMSSCPFANRSLRSAATPLLEKKSRNGQRSWRKRPGRPPTMFVT